MKKVLLTSLLASASLLVAAPLTMPADFQSDLTTTASNFGAGSLAIWGAVAVAVIGVAIFKKFFGGR